MSVKPILFNTDMVKAILDGRKTVTRRVIKYPQCGYFENEPPRVIHPYQPGDILYVRETFTDHWVPDEEGKPRLEYCYKADDIDIEAECLPGENNRWWPSIHMPKKAARIWLKVTDVRAERLQDMTEIDAEKEGSHDVLTDSKIRISALLNFYENIWNATIKKSDYDRYGWEANPWVWRITFERCKKP
jgi:hypothetical protein